MENSCSSERILLFSCRLRGLGSGRKQILVFQNVKRTVIFVRIFVSPINFRIKITSCWRGRYGIQQDFYLMTGYTWCWHHVIRVDKEKIILVPKRCQEITQIKIRHIKTTILCCFPQGKAQKIPQKTRFKYREEGRKC